MKWETGKTNRFMDCLLKNIDNDKLNDVTIHCSDGRCVQGSSYLLRISSDVIDDMLEFDYFTSNNTKRTDHKLILDCPRFSSCVMEKVRDFCHCQHVLLFSSAPAETSTKKKSDTNQKHKKMGKGAKYNIDNETFLDCPPTKPHFLEFRQLLQLMEAANYYNIPDLGTDVGDHVKSVIKDHPGYACIVIDEFGMNSVYDVRGSGISSLIYHARFTITSNVHKVLKLENGTKPSNSVLSEHASSYYPDDGSSDYLLGGICAIRSKDRLTELVKFMGDVSRDMYPLIEFEILNEWVANSRVPQAIEIARDINKNLNILKRVALTNADLITSPDGMLRSVPTRQWLHLDDLLDALSTVKLKSVVVVASKGDKNMDNQEKMTKATTNSDDTPKTDGWDNPNDETSNNSNGRKYRSHWTYAFA